MKPPDQITGKSESSIKTQGMIPPCNVLQLLLSPDYPRYLAGVDPCIRQPANDHQVGHVSEHYRNSVQAESIWETTPWIVK